jgi:hypothetical protein
MRSAKYAPLFSEKFVRVLEQRGWYDIEVRTLRLISRSQMALLNRLRLLRTSRSPGDYLFFILFKTFVLTESALATAYLWHRRINWDFRWLGIKIKTRFSRHASSKPLGGI